MRGCRPPTAVLQLPLPVCQKRCLREPRYLTVHKDGLPPAQTTNLELKVSGHQLQPSQYFRICEGMITFPSVSIQRPLALPRVRLRPLQAVNLSKAVQSALLGKKVSHPVKSADQTTVHPVCAARRRACLSATLLQLYVSSVPKTLCVGHSFPKSTGHSFPLYSVRIDVTDQGPTKPTWCSSLLWFMTIPLSAASFFNILDVLPIFVITSRGLFVTVSFVMSSAKNGG